MRIGLIRHGETDWNVKGLLQGTSDIPLNERGRNQADDASRLLVDADWQRIYSSPLGRARETARIISTRAGIHPAGVLPGFIERSFGALEGETYLTSTGAHRPLDDPSVEPVDQVQARALAAFDAIEDEHHDDSTLIVAHGTVIRLLLDLFLTFK
ncbi:MAG: histidine phosphatase family protein, partial [Pseudoclavibacter sp.]